MMTYIYIYINIHHNKIAQPNQSMVRLGFLYAYASEIKTLIIIIIRIMKKKLNHRIAEIFSTAQVAQSDLIWFDKSFYFRSISIQKAQPYHTLVRLGNFVMVYIYIYIYIYICHHTAVFSWCFHFSNSSSVWIVNVKQWIN